MAPAKLLTPESEGYYAPQDERDQFPVAYPDTPKSMGEGEWELDVHANGENEGHYI